MGGAFVSEDLALGRAPTVVTPEWLNAVQEELLGAISLGRLQPAKGNNGQLAGALRNLMGSFSGVASNPPSGPLTAAHVGKLSFVDLAVRTTVQLPLDPDIPVGSVFAICVGSGVGTMSVHPPAGGYIAYGSTSLGVNTPAIVRSDDSICLLKVDSSVFSVLSGGASASPGHSASLGANGWQRLSSGLIVQWFSAYPVTQTYTTLSFPIAFPNACRVAFAVHANGTANPASVVDVGVLTTTGVQVKTAASFAVGVNVLALGH